MQTYMMKSEKWTPPSTYDMQTYFAPNDAANHGTNGNIETTPYTWYSSVVSPFFTTLNNLGVQTNLAPVSYFFIKCLLLITMG